MQGLNTVPKEKVSINEQKQLLREVSSEDTSDWKQTWMCIDSIVQAELRNEIDWQCQGLERKYRNLKQIQSPPPKMYTHTKSEEKSTTRESK